MLNLARISNRLTIIAIMTMVASSFAIARAHSRDHVPLASKPAIVLYGGAKYSLSIPLIDNGKITNVSVVDVPKGILWMTPPGFPNEFDHAMTNWELWLTPYRKSGGTLWTNAAILHEFPSGSHPTIIGVTGNHVLIRQPTEHHLIQVFSYSLSSRHEALIASHLVGAISAYGFGAYAWVDSKGVVNVVNVNTGERDRASMTGIYPSDVLQPVAGGVIVSGKLVKMPIVDDPKFPVVPRNFKWATVGMSKQPVIALPRDWKITEIIGGSSMGISASNPKNKNEKIILYLNGCAGCYSPVLLSPQLVDAPFDSPLMGIAKNETYVWLNDHVVAYTISAAKGSHYLTYGITRTFINESGDEEIQINLPASDKHLATIILDSALSQL